MSSEMITDKTRTMDYVLQASRDYASIKPGKIVSISTLRRYHADGTKAVMLAGAGVAFVL